MTVLRVFASRIRALFTGRRRDAELDINIQTHLDLLTDEYVRRGSPLEEARAAARRDFGGVAQVKERYRHQRGVPVLEMLMQDLKYSLRTLRKTPVFSLTAAAILGLGIGANGMVFSIVNTVMLRPLPFHSSTDIVHVRRRTSFGSSVSFPMHDFLALREQRGALSALAILDVAADGRYNLRTGGTAEPISGVRVSAQFFSVFEAVPVAGRLFDDGDDEPGRPGEVVLSQGFWGRRFANDAAIIGRALTIGGRTYTVTGVAPDSLRAFSPADVYLSLTVPQTSADRGNSFQVLARIAPRLSLQQAETRLDAIARRHARASSLTNMPQGVVLRQLQDEMVGPVRSALGVLITAVALVLLVACSNVANLVLARGLSRRREIAVMAALGASRVRIARRVLTENLIVAAAGGALGLLLASGGIRALPALSAAKLPQLDRIQIDLWVLGFVCAAALFAGTMAGLVPALQLSRSDLTQWLKQSTAQGGSGAGGNRLRAALTLSQVALSTMLLVGAGLLTRSFLNLAAVDPGFQIDHLLTMTVSVADSRYPDSAHVAAYTQAIVERLERVPGVVAASSTTALPSEFPVDFPVTVLGGRSPARLRAPTGSEELDAWYRAINPHYFGAMGIPLLGGRRFDDGDTSASAPVIIVNNALARAAFENGDALGQSVVIGAGYLKDQRDLRPRTVVGVVGDTREQGLRFAPTMAMYVPVSQSPELITRLTLEKIPTRWVARTTGNPLDVVPAVRQAVLAVDPTQPPTDFSSMADVLARSIAPSRFNMLMLAIFAGLALTLAGIGIYGLTAYAVVQRTREIGIRLSLGASPDRVVGALVWHGVRLCLVGAGIGLGGSLVLGRFLRTLLFGVSSFDRFTFAVVVATMTAVVAGASYLPASHAARIDPIRALREE